jgi:hypothetical protein
MKAAIPLDSLPKTYQDAVRITRELDIRYLWIDALCIIQDSVYDWRFEASLMGTVYQNSWCNIAASDAADNTGGCLFKRNADAVQPFRIKTTPIHGTERWFIIHEPEGLEDAVLYSRAWVLQERLLASRVLNFRKRQLLWECREQYASETFPWGTKEDQANRNITKLKGLIGGLGIEDRPLEAPVSSRPPSLARYWRIVVEAYTKCHLTVSSDKLIALSGIASALKPLFGEYLAGLWKTHLPQELLWEVDRPSRIPIVRPPVYCAPSWSWASVQGEISFRYCSSRFEPDAEDLWVHILDVQVTTSDAQETGQVVDGSLQVRGRLTCARWKQETVSMIGGDEECFSFTEIGGITDLENVGCQSWIGFDDYNEMESQPNTVICLPILQRDRSVGTESTPTELNESEASGEMEMDDLGTDDEQDPASQIEDAETEEMSFEDEDSQTMIRHDEEQEPIVIHGLLLRALDNERFQRIGTFFIEGVMMNRVFEKLSERVINIV